jgi:hypothetical protein
MTVRMRINLLILIRPPLSLGAKRVIRMVCTCSTVLRRIRILENYLGMNFKEATDSNHRCELLSKEVC